MLSDWWKANRFEFVVWGVVVGVVVLIAGARWVVGELAEARRQRRRIADAYEKLSRNACRLQYRRLRRAEGALRPPLTIRR